MLLLFRSPKLVSVVYGIGVVLEVDTVKHAKTASKKVFGSGEFEYSPCLVIRAGEAAYRVESGGTYKTDEEALNRCVKEIINIYHVFNSNKPAVYRVFREAIEDGIPDIHTIQLNS